MVRCQSGLVVKFTRPPEGSDRGAQPPQLHGRERSPWERGEVRAVFGIVKLCVKMAPIRCREPS